MLLYDEPTAGLDPIASTVVEDLIRSVHMKGEDALGKPGNIASYVVVTHQHSTISRAVDRLCSVQTLNSVMFVAKRFCSAKSKGCLIYVGCCFFMRERLSGKE